MGVIVFYEGIVKHIYFAAKAKNAVSHIQLRLIEKLRLCCVWGRFRSISHGGAVHDGADSYKSLIEEKGMRQTI